MKRLLIIAPLLGGCFQPWTVDGLYRCGGGCPEGMECDDGVCCKVDGTPACPTKVPPSGRCADGSLPKSYYADADNDTFGNPAVSALACSRPLLERWVDNMSDCDDGSAAAHPGGSEICDGRDNNCNGSIDEGQTPLQAYFRDTDGDGYGVDAEQLMACACANNACVPPGYAGTAGDCDGMNNAIFPGAVELCNGDDDNCNMQTDENVSVGVGAPCSDAGMGECAQGTLACVGGAITCRATKTPVKDICDGLDNNCNGTPDDQPDCGGPNALLTAGAALIGARDTGSVSQTQTTPASCFGRTLGTAEQWASPVWAGTSDNFHVWYAEAPGTTVWDLSKPGLKLHLQFTTSMLMQNTTTPWNQFNQPFVLVCNASGTFTRYRPLNASLLTTSSSTVNTDIPFAGGNGWLLAQGGADLTQVKRIEVVIEPGNNGATVPRFTITFNTSTGFKP